jgi:hypothetical protein
MMKCSVKNEITPLKTYEASNALGGALISFSAMKSALALFSPALPFCYFWVKPKVSTQTA